MKILSLRKVAGVLLLLSLLSGPGCSEKQSDEPQAEGKILVLMYHRIVNGQAGNEYERSAADLEKDLVFFKDNNFNVLSFNDLNDVNESGKMPSGNSVILTFDDGDHSWITLVKPLLLKYHMRATFFLWVNMIGHDSFLSWSDVESMSYYTTANGEKPFVFGSHSMSHSYLLQNKSGYASDTDYNAYLDYEFGRSKSMIEEHVPGNVTAFSLPYGDGAGDPEITAAALRNGYKFIRTSVWGNITSPGTNLLNIPSLPVLDTTSVKFINYYLNR